MWNYEKRLQYPINIKNFINLNNINNVVGQHEYRRSKPKLFYNVIPFQRKGKEKPSFRQNVRKPGFF